MELKNYSSTIQFKVIEVNVRAKNRNEAKKKIKAVIARKNPVKLIDQLLYDEV